jgi:tetratricopeptide (TPR) repeat protein
MIGKIIFTLVSFLLFFYVFVFKLIKKNDTVYLTILISQAIGILINLVQILFNVLNGWFFTGITYIICIIFPITLLILETKGINFGEYLRVCVSGILLAFGNRKKAKELLINLVSKYDKSYIGHKLLAEIYKQEGGMRKAIDEYVKVLDIRGNDYKSYFKISKLLDELGKKDEAIEMLTILVNKKPELYDACTMLGNLLIEKEKFKKATNIFMQGIKYNPDRADLYYDLGITYTRMNEFSLAKKCYEKTCEIDSNFYNSYYRLGQLALLYRDIEAAERYFLQAMYGETEIKSYYQLAKIYLIKNDKNKAAMFINRAIEMDKKYYDIIESEPIFLPINQFIIKTENNINVKVIEETEKEKKISAYLDDTYTLTRVLDQKQAKTNKRKF